MAASLSLLASFETPRQGAAPQDEGSIHSQALRTRPGIVAQALSLRAREPITDLILRSAFFTRVSKDGGRVCPFWHPSRRRAKARLIRMRAAYIHRLSGRDRGLLHRF